MTNDQQILLINVLKLQRAVIMLVDIDYGLLIRETEKCPEILGSNSVLDTAKILKETTDQILEINYTRSLEYVKQFKGRKDLSLIETQMKNEAERSIEEYRRVKGFSN